MSFCGEKCLYPAEGDKRAENLFKQCHIDISDYGKAEKSAAEAENAAYEHRLQAQLPPKKVNDCGARGGHCEKDEIYALGSDLRDIFDKAQIEYQKSSAADTRGGKRRGEKCGEEIKHMCLLFAKDKRYAAIDHDGGKNFFEQRSFYIRESESTRDTAQHGGKHIGKSVGKGKSARREIQKDR